MERARQSTTAQWQHYQAGLSGHLTSAVAIFAGAMGLGAVLNVFIANWVFVAVDATIAVGLGLVLAYRHRLGTVAIVAVICFAGYGVSTLSFIRSGLIGSGVLTLMVTNVVAIIFLTARPAIILSTLSSLLVLAIGVAVNFGLITFSPELAARQEHMAAWAMEAVAVAGFCALVVIMVRSLRQRFLAGITDLEGANRELERTNARIEKLAFYDPLTGLPNRNLFRTHVEQRIEAHISHGTVIIVDLKRFRLFNSLYGAQRGDHLLHAFGEQLAGYREIGVFGARLGGDEFAAWVEGWSEEQLARNLEKLRADVRASMSAVDAEYLLEYYVAFAEYPEDGDSHEELMANASIALRSAKDRGTSDPVRYTMAMGALVDESNELAAALRRALDENEFFTVYQPKVELSTGRTVGVEALARWRSRQLGEVPPAQFVPALVRANEMIRFSEVIFERVLADLPRVRSRYGEAVTVSINVSPVQVLQPGFVETILRRLDQLAIPPATLTLEITEDVFVGDVSVVRGIIELLARNGVRVALDDFGKGFSSLYYIRSIPFSELKIDKSFIDDITHDERSRRLFDSICSIAETYGYGVVAEGVETEEQVATLRTTLCQVVQGYYFARPEQL